MYQQGDRVIYGMQGVCEIVGTEVRSIDRKKVEYFVLQPLDHHDTRFYVPTQNKTALGKLRPILSADELNTLLLSEETRRDGWIADEGQRKNHYRELINSCDRCALLRMVRTLYLHKASRTAQGRKFHQCDENFLRDAEKLLYSEFSLVLGMELHEAGQFIKDTLLNQKDVP